MIKPRSCPSSSACLPKSELLVLCHSFVWAGPRHSFIHSQLHKGIYLYRTALYSQSPRLQLCHSFRIAPKMTISTKSIITATAFTLFSALPSLVVAHAHVTNIIVNGQDFPGFPSDDAGSAQPSIIAWKVNVPNNGFTRDYSSPDIICHKEASPGKASANIAAGGTVEFQWTQWPSHQGPVVDYMAACPGKCEDADKTQLQWFKIAEQGLVSETGCNVKGNTGCWALDKLIQAGNKWPVKVPSDLKAGNYVMRHEVINLDFPGQSQNYPACVNLAVTGGGSSSPKGVVGTSLYTGQEPGLNFNIYGLKSAEYPIPGPPIATGYGGSEAPAGNGTTSTSASTSTSPSTSNSPSTSASASSGSSCSAGGNSGRKARRWAA